MIIRSICASIAAVLLLTSPVAAQVTKVNYKAPHPAKAGEAAKLKRIAVLEFQGTEGAQFSATLTAELRSAMFNDLPYFEVISADGVMAVGTPKAPVAASATPGRGKKKTGSTIKVIPMADTPVSRAIRIGRAAQVDGVVIGTVTASIERRESTESRLGPDGKMVPQPCQSATVTFNVVPRVISVETGQVAYSRTVATRDSFKICAGQVDRGTIGNVFRDVENTLGGLLGKKKIKQVVDNKSENMKVESELGLITKVSKAATEQIVSDISPYNEDVVVSFYPDSNKLPKPKRTDFQNATTFAKAGRFDRACAMWESLKSPETENNVPLMFNIAMCAWVEVIENPSHALKLMREVEAKKPSFDKDIDAALQMLQKAAADRGELAKQVQNK